MNKFKIGETVTKVSEAGKETIGKIVEIKLVQSEDGLNNIVYTIDTNKKSGEPIEVSGEFFELLNQDN